MTEPEFETFVDPVDGTEWSIDMTFIDSNWKCIWGQGCEGILEHPAKQLNQGCCSVGAEILDEDEALQIGALGLSLDPMHFEQADAALAHGVFRDDARDHTAVVDDACIFFNRPGFAGGEGCALHIAALADGDDPTDYKPAICWQVPILVDHNDDGTKTLRPWRRRDMTPDIDTVAWCCTSRTDEDLALANAYVGDQPVAVSLHNELRGLVGPEIAVELRARHVTD